MTKASTSQILQLIHHGALDQRLWDLSDHDLVQRFNERRDEAAFNALLFRHGPMVLDVCRGVLAIEADVEDAFQATFLILARKAASIRKAASVGSWLHGVAYRTALKAQAQSATRKKNEARVPGPQASEPDDLTWREVRKVLHEELTAIAERYRAPLVACYLEGMTQDEAAARLGMATSTLKERLERGRSLLRARLVRRGIGPTGALLATAWPSAIASACLTAKVLSDTIKAADLLAVGKTATTGLIPDNVAALAEGVLKTMFAKKLKAIVAVVLLAALTGVGVGVFIHTAGAEAQDKSAKAKDEPSRPVKGDEVVDAEEPVTWQPLIEGKIATVSVAKSLFEQKEGKYFLTGVRVTNKTDREIAVDLRSRRSCVRINQWSATDTAARTTIDESRVIRADFTEEVKASVVKALRSDQLVRIPAGKSVDYYCPFIGEERQSVRAAVDKLPTKFVILSMDGELRVTNGEHSESLRCGEPGDADVSIPRPVPWRPVPRDGRIVDDDEVASADKVPDANEVEYITLTPPGQSGWMIRIRPDGSLHAQYGSALGDAAHMPKGSVDFGALLKAAHRLKSDKRSDRLSTIAVSLKDAANTAFNLTDDTLFRYLIDSFDEKWEPDLGGTRFDKLRSQYPIYKDASPTDRTPP